jgi:thiamine pyrophosphate-dependent acetolactate synthase large subunit-like protein
MFLYLKAGQHLLVSSRLGTMGFSIPALIGARLADPQRRPIGFVGDGCFAMTGMELAYAAAMRLPLVIVVVNNGILQNVAAMQANPYGTALPPIDFVAMSRACGGDGLVIDGSTDLLAALDLALAPRDTPFVIDLRCDPELVAPLSKWEASRWAAATR